MLDEKQREHVSKSVVTLQIISGALVIGVLVFAGLVLVLFQSDEQGEQESQPVLSYVGIAFCGLAIPAALVVPRIMDAGNRKKILAGEPLPNYSIPSPELGEVGTIVSMYMGRHMVSLAILEGAAFMNLTALMMEDQKINLYLTALLLAIMLLKFPTRSSLETWVDSEQKMLAELRSLPG